MGALSVFPDRFIIEFDRALRTLWAPAASTRAVPGQGCPEKVLDAVHKRRVCGLMRVNHSGEVCAQALYQGQALTSRDVSVRDALRDAANEETEHLAWTEQRLADLGGRKSLLNPLWYLGALSIGVTAGVLGDRWSLGFLAETERQVEAHLDGHLRLLSEDDERSLAIVDQMRQDEKAHAETALALGAAELPPMIRMLMKASARVMTTTAYCV